MQAYYRAIPSQNLLVTEKIHKRQVQKHQEKLKAIRSTVDNKPPKHFSQKTSKNPKKQQMMEERNAIIERDNRLLVGKMAKIMSEEHEHSEKKTRSSLSTPKSLNLYQRKEELHRINSQNFQILDRLKKIKPTYSAKEWEKDHERNEKILQHMAIYKPPKSAPGPTGESLVEPTSSSD